jgi:stage V sporulation protein R
MQTKIMNEGWASYWHSKLMTEKVATAGDIIDYAERNASVLAISPGQMNPYKIGVELYRYIEDRWNRGQFGSDWDACTDLEDKLHWDKKLGLGRQKIFEVRALYNDVTFLDEYLTPEFCVQSKLFSYQWNPRNDRYEVASREYQKIKEQLLFSLTNFGNPFIYVQDANHENRGELLLVHDHHGTDLRHDYAKEVLSGLVRIWKRPVILRTKQENKVVFIKFDGREHTTTKA